MPERYIPKNLSVPDKNFHLSYGASKDKMLVPCEPITDELICLGIIGNGIVHAAKLLLLPKDRAPIHVQNPTTNEIYSLTYPGKSAILGLDPNICDKEILNLIVKGQLGTEPDRRDHLHISSVAKIMNAGWVAFWAPLQLEHKIAHARLVAKRTIDYAEDPTLEDAQKLANVFEKKI